jgi:hypothetical protein
MVNLRGGAFALAAIASFATLGVFVRAEWEYIAFASLNGTMARSTPANSPSA